jgi:hypothetical protein
MKRVTTAAMIGVPASCPLQAIRTQHAGINLTSAWLLLRLMMALVMLLIFCLSQLLGLNDRLCLLHTLQHRRKRRCSCRLLVRFQLLRLADVDQGFHIFFTI